MKKILLTAGALALAAGAGGWAGYRYHEPSMRVKAFPVSANGANFAKEAFRSIDDELAGKVAELAGTSAHVDHLVAVVPTLSGYELKISAPAASPLWEKREDLSAWITGRMGELEKARLEKAAALQSELAAAQAPPPAPEIPKATAEQLEKERAAAEANAALVDAQEKLATERQKTFKERPDLGYAYEAEKTYGNWQQMNARTPEIRTWWNNQKDPAVRTAMREVTRKLAVQEFAARHDDPNSTGWMRSWSGGARVNSPEGLQERARWWNDEATELPDFETLPPADVIAALMDPKLKMETVKLHQITEVERSLLPPPVVFYLENAAQAGIFSKGGESYYHQSSSTELQMLEADVVDLNARAIQFNEWMKNP